MSYFSFCFQLLIGIPLIASSNIDCGGKSFNCLNSTHFRICVDLGGGVSTTVDDFVIPCPSPTVCSHNNRFECEFPQSVRIPLAVPITLTSATNELESATTLEWEKVTVPTTLPFNTSVGHLELQNYTTVSTESLLVEVTTSASIINNNQNETVTEIIPIPNTTFKPQITTIDNILVNDTNLLNETESVVDVIINKTTVIPKVTSNATQANIITTNITENEINETTVITNIEVTTSSTTEANISTSNVIDDNIKETTGILQIEVISSTGFAGNKNKLNTSENNINEKKLIPDIEVIATTVNGTNNTITSNMTEKKIVTKTYETSTDISTGTSDTNETNSSLNNIASSAIENIIMDTSVNLETTIITTESGRAASRVDDMTTKVSTPPNFQKNSEAMNTISATTTYTTNTAHNYTSGLLQESVNQSVTPVEVNRKKATEVIDSITTVIPEILENSDVNATLNSGTLVEEVIARTTTINIDVTSTLPSVHHNEAFVTESNIYVTTETNVKETTIVTAPPETVSASISEANLFVTQSPIFRDNTESNVRKTASTAQQATEVVSNADDNVILNLKAPAEGNTTSDYNKSAADKVKEGINAINVPTSTSVPITIQNIDVVTLNSSNLDGETFVTTISNVKASTEASNTIVTVISDIVPNIDIKSTINVNAPAKVNLTSITVPSLKTMSNVTDATFNPSTFIEELTSPAVSETDISKTGTSMSTNDISMVSTISPDFPITINSELIELTDIKNEITTPSNVSEAITTEYKIKENTETYETTIINNFSPLFDTNSAGNITEVVETRKSAVFSDNSTVTTISDNIMKTQTSTSELNIIKSTTESAQNLRTEYPSNFSQLLDNETTTNAKINNEITTNNTITKVAANDYKNISVNALTNNTFQEKVSTLIENHSILDIADIQLNNTDVTNETVLADKSSVLSSTMDTNIDNNGAPSNSANFSDTESTTENYQHITRTNDHQLNFESTTSDVLPTQLIQDRIGNNFGISEVISFNKTNVSPTTDAVIDTNILQSNNTNIKITTDTMPPPLEEVHSTTTVFVTQYLPSDAPNTEAGLNRRSGMMIDKEDTSTTPIASAVYKVTSQNELLKTLDNAGDFVNSANQVRIAPSPTESSLLNDATTNIITTPQSVSELQTPNTNSYNSPTVKEPFATTSESIILTTESILENNINATGIQISTEITEAGNLVYNGTISTERTNAMSITLTPIATSEAHDAVMWTETGEVISTTQDNKAFYDTDVPEELRISTVKDNNNYAKNTQLFNVPTISRTLEILVDVNTESAQKNLDLIKTDIDFNSVAPTTEGNIISSTLLSGNDISINKKSPSNDNVTSGSYVDESTFSTSHRINNLTTAFKTQNDFLNTIITNGASSPRINLETGNTETSSTVRPVTDGLLKQTSTTTEYERNSSLQLNSQNNVQPANGVTYQPETEIPTQTMTAYVDSEYISPSGGIFAVQETLKSEKDQTGTTEILETKKTNVPAQGFTNNVIMTDIREKPTTDTAIGGTFASTALSPAMVSVGSKTKINSLPTNTASWETATVQGSVNSDTLRSIDTIASKTIPVLEYANKISIISAINSTTSPDSGKQFSDHTNALENVPLTTHEASANHHLITSVPVPTTDRPAGTVESSSFKIQTIGPITVNYGFYTSQTDKHVPESTSGIKVSSVHNPDPTISLESNTNQIVLSPNTVTWERKTVQESISSGVQRFSNKDDEKLEIIPLMQNEIQDNNSTASPSSGTDISNIKNPLENVLFNMQGASANKNKTTSAAVATTYRPADIPTSTENLNSMIQSTGLLSVTDGYWSGQKYETQSIGTTSSNAGDTSWRPIDVINSKVSVLPDRVKTVPQLPDVNSGLISHHYKKPTINNFGVINQTETNSENLPNTRILKVPVSISENTHHTDNVVKEDSDAVKDSKWRPTPDTAKNNFNNISLSVQSTSTLSITTSNVKLNVTETIFTNSSVEFHTAVSKTNVNAQPPTNRNIESLPNSGVAKTSPLNDGPNLLNNDITNIPVVIIDRETVNNNHNVNVELSIVQNSSQSLTKPTTSTQTATIVPKPPKTITATEANVRQTQTTRNTIGSTHPVVTTGQLSIMNTVKVDVERTNVNTNFNFDCQNRTRGRYSDKTDCRKFYVCIGMRQPIEGLCPVNTVFSEIKKQCTKNLSYCIRQNQFKCVTNGRFSYFLEHNVYFICVKNHREEFVKFKFQCQNGYKLDKIMVRCVEDETEPPNKSISNDSEATIEKNTSSNNRDLSKTYDNSYSTNENAKDKVLKTVKDKSRSERNKGNKDFKCEKEGKFPDSKSCREYYVCSKSNRSEEYRQRRKKCDSDEVFHKEKKKCVDADSFECS